MEPHEQSTHASPSSESENPLAPDAPGPTPAGLPTEETAQTSLAPDAATEPKEAEAKLENPVLEKKRIEDQLLALKRRESELRRALATASHPELADAIRLIEGRAYALSRVEAKMAEGLSKSEEKRRQNLEKKRAVLEGKRNELDAQIAVLESELLSLGVERTRAFELERRAAMEQLIAALGAHGKELAAAGLEASQLVPEIAHAMPEIQALAEELVRPARNDEPETPLN